MTWIGYQVSLQRTPCFCVLDGTDIRIVGQVDRLLRELGQSVQGREDARRRRLVTTTGVRNRAVEEPSRDRVMQRRQR